MTEQTYDHWQGRTVRSTVTGREFICHGIFLDCLYLSGGQIIPFDAVLGKWELVEK